MDKQTEYANRLKEFNKARIDFDQTVQDVADKFGYSKRRLYNVLKYPNENPDLFKKIAKYVSGAGYDLKHRNNFDQDRTQKAVSH